MNIGQKVYTYNKITEKKEGSILGSSRYEMRTGVIVAKERRWVSGLIPTFYYEYIVRETADLGKDGIAGVLQAAFSGKPESLTMHRKDTLYTVFEPPVVEVEGEE